MIRRAALAALYLVAAGTLAAADPDSQPYAAMRTLQALQEQVAHGNTTAQTAQPKLMEHIADGFLAADPAVWREPRNARAAILFLLSGGRPAVVRTLLEHADFPDDLDRLLKGALAYGEGQDEAARGLLDGIDPQSVPSGLGAHLALVRANLAVDRDLAKATKLFDTARLLAPGTLIEEAALRREVFVLIDTGTTDKAMLLARQYLRRFRTSSYADNFKQRFAAAALQMAMAGNITQLAQLDTVLNELTPGEVRGFYLYIAKGSLVGGKTAGARFAAQKVISMSAKGSNEEMRARLYAAAAMVVSERTPEGIESLSALDNGRLSADDERLRVAALAIGSAVRSEGSQIAPGADPELTPADPAQDTIVRARAAIAESEALLRSTKP